MVEVRHHAVGPSGRGPRSALIAAAGAAVVGALLYLGVPWPADGSGAAGTALRLTPSSLAAAGPTGTRDGVPGPSASSTPVPASSAVLRARPSASARPDRSTSPASGPAAIFDVNRLGTLPAATRQVILVLAESTAATSAQLQAFVRVGAGWQARFPATPARVGAAGLTAHKTENDSGTPIGLYGIGPVIYGLAADPGVRYPYHRLVTGDFWNENPGTAGYNGFAHGPDPGGNSEALWRVSPQYDYFAVIDYNIPVVPARPARGSGIFLHVLVPGHATAGCVAIDAGALRQLLRWLDPAAAPRILLAPRSALSRF